MGIEPPPANHIAAGRRQGDLTAAGKQRARKQDRGADPRAQCRIEVGGADFLGMDGELVAASPFRRGADRADQLHQRFGVANTRHVFQCDRMLGQERRRDDRQRRVLVAGRFDRAA